MHFSLRRLACLVAAGAISLAGAAAHAATFTYDLLDHGYGNMAHTFDYGLRLDRETPDRFFSFENGAAATLVYDDVDLTATISGSMREHLGRDQNNMEVLGELFTISYKITGVTDMGDGQFVDYSGTGTGSIFRGNDVLALGAAANNALEYFIFKGDGHRLPNDSDTHVGRGWVQKNPGANDFLFQASLRPDDNVPPVPLPAAGWMLIAGLAGLGLMGRRKA